MAKQERSFLVTYPRLDTRRHACGTVVGTIRGETFFFARQAEAIVQGIEPGEIRIAGGKAGGA